MLLMCFYSFILRMRCESINLTQTEKYKQCKNKSNYFQLGLFQMLWITNLSSVYCEGRRGGGVWSVTNVGGVCDDCVQTEILHTSSGCNVIVLMCSGTGLGCSQLISRPKRGWVLADATNPGQTVSSAMLQRHSKLMEDDYSPAKLLHLMLGDQGEQGGCFQIT